jgi:hypothetical protein
MPYNQLKVDRHFRGTCHYEESGYEVGVALGYWAGWPEFESWQHKLFLFPTLSKPTLGPTQPPIKWVLGTPSLGGKAARAWS